MITGLTEAGDCEENNTCLDWQWTIQYDMGSKAERGEASGVLHLCCSCSALITHTLRSFDRKSRPQCRVNKRSKLWRCINNQEYFSVRWGLLNMMREHPVACSLRALCTWRSALQKASQKKKENVSPEQGRTQVWREVSLCSSEICHFIPGEHTEVKETKMKRQQTAVVPRQGWWELPMWWVFWRQPGVDEYSFPCPYTEHAKVTYSVKFCQVCEPESRRWTMKPRTTVTLAGSPIWCGNWSFSAASTRRSGNCIPPQDSSRRWRRFAWQYFSQYPTRHSARTFPSSSPEETRNRALTILFRARQAVSFSFFFLPVSRHTTIHQVSLLKCVDTGCDKPPVKSPFLRTGCCPLTHCENRLSNTHSTNS